jgi:hypothetical protein
MTLYTHAYVTEQFHYSFATIHSRVRRATVRPTPFEDETTIEGLAQAMRVLRWSERSENGGAPLPLRVGKTVELPVLDDYCAFGTGWATPEAAGIWTRGPRADVRLSVDASSVPHLLSMSVGRVGVRPGDSLVVTMVIDGERTATRSFSGGTPPVDWRVPFPSRVTSRPSFELVLEMDAGGRWGDDRQLGLHVRSLAIERRWPPALGEIGPRLRRSLRRVGRGGPSGH